MKDIKRSFKGLMVLALCLPLMASAQNGSGAGHVGGGEVTASDFQDFINKIDEYLLTSAGQASFPEIQQPGFHHIVTKVKPVVKDERVFDSFGVAQTCVSHAVEGNRYFQCDLSRLPKINLDNQPTFYRIVFHELLFQAGLELPISRDVPSDFQISSRLKLHLETFQAWVPGQAQPGPRMIKDSGFSCSGDASDDRLSYHAYWKPNGDFILLSQFVPRTQAKYGMPHMSGEFFYELGMSLGHISTALTAPRVVTRLLAHGNSMKLVLGSWDERSLPMKSDDQKIEYQLQTPVRIDEREASDYKQDRFVATLYIDKVGKGIKSVNLICDAHLPEKPSLGRLGLEEVFSNPQKKVYKNNWIMRGTFSDPF